jgi:hypothetical protein
MMRAVAGTISDVVHQILTRWAVVLALAVLSLSPWCAQAKEPPQPAKIDFDREVRPILADNCYECHGPDEKARKAKLRLDTREGAFRVRDGESVITPGKSAESELIKRITSTDPDEHMPPPDSNHKLTERQIEMVKRWIDEGATWSAHWAFAPIRRPALPKVKNAKWPANEVDRFILARLELEGLAPTSVADRERLLRRVTFDLSGLPPTLEEIDAFLADKSPKAYETVVDRLLASARYGERMATEWLDLARYADTYGYQMDAPRSVWPYRDWVIKALNQNLSFDQFITWQLAGDLLPNATKEQRLATAFNRLHLANEEGGVVEEEFRVAYVSDRVDTFGTAFLGLTVQCAHCHDHKFDPITMRDFYSLFAMFQNIDESGQNPYSAYVHDPPAPTLLLSDDATDAKLAKMQKRIAAKEKEAPALRDSAQAAFSEWLKAKPSAADVPGLVAAFSFDELKDSKITNSADAAKPGKLHETPKSVAGKTGEAAQLDGESGFSFPGIGHFKRTDPFTMALWLNIPVHAARQVVVHRSKAPADAGSRGYELLLEEGRPAIGVHRQWPGISLKVRCKNALPTNDWVHVSFTYDGSSRATGLRVFINGKPAETEVIRNHLWKDITYDTGEPDLAIGYRFRDSGFKDGKVDEFRVYNRALTAVEVAEVAGRSELKSAWEAKPEALTNAQRESLLEYYLANVYPPARQFANELVELRREQNGLINPIPEIMVMEETAEPKPAYILKRGAYDQPGEQVTANTLAALPPLPANAPRNRLGLARWLVASENPLLARVTVNRAWHMVFGQGIVETTDNFGSRGAPPSHPELLDWLAHDFMSSGWDYKRLLKKMVLSATYRQSSKASNDLIARDAANRLLGRAPVRRLSAEMMRDQALAVGGLLVEKIGGPSVKPYQPPGLWEIAMGNPKYDQSHGEELYRRSLYTFWKRTVPPPGMTVFDAPERNVCLVQRQTTSTPLQALCLLNDTQLTEAARFISQRMWLEGGATEDERIQWAFRSTTSRRPTADEVAVLKRLLHEQRDVFAADPQAAARLLAVGEAANSPTLSTIDLAAGTMLAQALLNHDEAIMRR